jgi:hypothetical protein
VAEHGARNFPVALMPTATTSIMGSAGEAMEPYSSMFTRKTLAGEFIVVNRALVRTLEERGLWNERQEAIIMNEVRPGLDEDLVPGTYRHFKTVGPQAEGSSDHAATVPLTSASPSPPTSSCQRRRAARCRRLCSMGGSRPRQLLPFAYKAGGSCTALHDRPQGPSLRSQKRRRTILCCVLGVRAARPWAEPTVWAAQQPVSVHTQSTDFSCCLRPMPSLGVVHREQKSACCRTAFRALAAVPDFDQNRTAQVVLLPDHDFGHDGICVACKISALLVRGHRGTFTPRHPLDALQ